MTKTELITKVVLMDEQAMQRALMRISYEIIEKNASLEDVVLIGIKTRGGPLARIIRDNIRRHTGVEIPMAVLDVRYYRDDLEKVYDNPKVTKDDLPVEIDGRSVVLVDDVLYTGRTVRAAIDALFDLGRPAKVSLAILVDRGHRELPIRPDYIGKNVPTSSAEVISVNLEETDGKTNVELLEKVTHD